ncbi:MAG: hypothetical protein R3E10_07805 [Gemmatimonadota bacterium]
MRNHPPNALRRITLPVVLALFACSDGEAPPSAAPPAAALPNEESTEGPGRSYERTLIFLSYDADEPLVLPWAFDARTRPGSVERQVAAWLFRSDAWEQFFAAEWSSPPSRAPWRLLPHEGMGLVVGENDNVEHVLFRQPPNELDLIVTDEQSDWSGPRGEEIRVLTGALGLTGQATQGSVIDLSRNWRPAERTPGDWLILASGDSVHVILEGEGLGAAATYRGWARVDDIETQWPALSVEWSEVRSFEPARRDVPNQWSLATSDEELSGEVRVRASRLQAGTADAPQLPVEALFLLEGSVTLYGVEYPILGLAIHSQS